MTLYIGLMSGTSMDGMDAVLIDVDTQQLLAGITHPYDSDVRDQLCAIAENIPITPSQLWQLHTLIGREFAGAANALLESSTYLAHQITAIGSHGQTISHDAFASIPYTIQLGCPHTIAELTGITVVADFRTRDMVVGGQGAPFAPLYHQALFQGMNTSLAVVNLGGIANVTILGNDQKTYGYDIGPANCLLDAWIYKETGQAFDNEGGYAASGKVIPDLLKSLLNDEYFQLPFPKSICKSYFSLEWLNPFLKSHYKPQDVQATLLALTAQNISDAIQSTSFLIPRLALCGGGAHNHALSAALRYLLPKVEVVSTQELGIDPDFLEAMMFGWLAHQTLSGTHLDLSHITGSRKPAILGAIYQI